MEVRDESRTHPADRGRSCARRRPVPVTALGISDNGADCPYTTTDYLTPLTTPAMKCSGIQRKNFVCTTLPAD